MKAQTPPELADGGFWYSVEAVVSPDATTVSVSSGWCAWYGEVNSVLYAAVRTPEAVSGIQTSDIPVRVVLAANGDTTKPHGRIGGN